MSPAIYVESLRCNMKNELRILAVATLLVTAPILTVLSKMIWFGIDIGSTPPLNFIFGFVGCLFLVALIYLIRTRKE